MTTRIIEREVCQWSQRITRAGLVSGELVSERVRTRVDQ